MIDKKVFGRFIMGKFCLTNIVVVHNEVIGQVDGGVRVGVYLAYSKFFFTLALIIFS